MSHHTTCTTCGTVHDSGMDETVTACPACPTTYGVILAECAADALTRFADDLDQATGSPQDLATLATDRVEVVGALERLEGALGLAKGSGTAMGQRAILADTTDQNVFVLRALNASMFRAWAAAWRAFADA